MIEVNTKDLLSRNKAYSKTHVPIPTGKEQLAASNGTRPPMSIVISCLDSRIIPDQFLQLAPAEVTVIRNIGGRVDDSVILQIAALGALRPLGDILIIHHDDCGATKFTEEYIKRALTEKYGKDDRIDGTVFGAIADLPQSLRDDVEIMRTSTFVNTGTLITGLLYNIKTGLVNEVCSATK
jgi:carbonic anhydrase